MKFKSLLIGILSILSLYTQAGSRLDSLLKVLDKTVAERNEYTTTKDQQIQKLKEQLSLATVDEQKYSLTAKLFDLYSNYQTDSAYHIAKQRLELAEKIGQPNMIGNAKMNMAAILRTTGMYKESLELLDEINEQGLRVSNERYYLHLRHSLYILLSNYSIADEDKRKYNGLVFNYKDSILAVTPKDDVDFYLVSSTRHVMLGEYNEALQIMEKIYSSKEPNALICHTLAEIYRCLGDRDKEKEFLAESAIADLKSGVKEYISLQELAALLFEEGSIDRAHTYMKASMEDASFCNARLRTLEIAKMLPIISKTYNLKIEQEQRRLLRVFAVTILLAVILFIALTYIYRQVKKLSAIRKYQKEMNLKLVKMNEELNFINSELKDSNLIKEEYISYLFKVYSAYINKLEDFRKTVNRKVKTGQIDDLNKMTSSSSFVSDELKEFYRNFDSIFLDLYPTFVAEFNNLLKEEDKIELKEGDLLTPELRIYALIRLGIKDSVKIADILHYSPQTIYNYRLKIRNKLTINREEFPDALSNIGRETR